MTSLEFRLYPAATVYGGTARFPIERAPDVVAFFRDWAPPRELTTTLVVTRESLTVCGVYAGPAGTAERALRPLWQVAGEPSANDFRVMSYADIGTIGGTASRGFELFRELHDELIAKLCSPDAGFNAVAVRRWGGAMAEPETATGTAAGPIGHRDVPFSLTIDGTPESVEPLRAFSTGGSFLNFLRNTTRTHIVELPAADGTQRAYDPDNLFGLSHNIPPGHDETR